MQSRDPKAHALLPVDPIFRTDDEFLPLQAADLFAWWFRNSGEWNQGVSAKPSEGLPFAWLIDELDSVRVSDYSHFFDKDRMRSILRGDALSEADHEALDSIANRYRVL